MYVALKNQGWEKLTRNRIFKRILSIRSALLLIIATTLFIKLFCLIDAPVAGLVSPVTEQKKTLFNRALALHACTWEESEMHGARFQLFGLDWSGCYSDPYLMSFDFDKKRSLTLIDVGSNKAYAVATWLAFFVPHLSITQASLYRYLQSTGKVTYACGSCNDCEDPPMKAEKKKANITLHIHAFEPQPGTAALLREVQTWMNISARSPSTFDIYGMAISNFVGQTIFKKCNTGNEVCSLDVSKTDKNDQVQVGVITLDTFAEQHNLSVIDIIKIDTEGFEPFVFQGAQKLLQQHRIRLFIFEHLKNTGAWNGTSLLAEVSKLAKLDYICYMIGKTGLLLVTNCWNEKLNIAHSNLLCVSSKDRQLVRNINRLTLMGTVAAEYEFVP